MVCILEPIRHYKLRAEQERKFCHAFQWTKINGPKNYLQCQQHSGLLNYILLIYNTYLEYGWSCKRIHFQSQFHTYHSNIISPCLFIFSTKWILSKKLKFMQEYKVFSNQIFIHDVHNAIWLCPSKKKPKLSPTTTAIYSLHICFLGKMSQWIFYRLNPIFR